MCVDMRVIKTLPPVGGEVVGITRIGDELFVLRIIADIPVDVYSAKTSADYKRLRQFTIKGLRGYGITYGMTSCERHKCLYFSGDSIIHKSTTAGDVVAKWQLRVYGSGCLSLTPTNNLLFTNTSRCVLQEIDSESGTLIRQVELQSDIKPWHAVQLADQHYVVVAREIYGDKLHRVCVVDVNGEVVLSYGGQPGSSETQLNNPRHIAVDRDNFIFVADRDNHRVVLLSPNLQLVRHIKLTEMPNRLYLDQKTRRLYIGHEVGRVTIIQT